LKRLIMNTMRDQVKKAQMAMPFEVIGSEEDVQS